MDGEVGKGRRRWKSSSAAADREEEDVDKRDDPWASRHDCLGDEEEGGEAERMVRFDLPRAA